MQTIKHSVVERRKVTLQQKVDKLKIDSNTASITFVREDDSKIVQHINREFLLHAIGRRKTNQEIINDIYALSHDLGAKYFIV